MSELIYEMLTQEVTIAMNDLFANKRSRYEALWQHLNAFVKYSVLQDKIFAGALGERISNLKLNITNLDTEAINVLIIHDEKSRRMADMMEMYGLIGDGDSAAREIQSGSTLLVNMNNGIIRYILEADDIHFLLHS